MRRRFGQKIISRDYFRLLSASLAACYLSKNRLENGSLTSLMNNTGWQPFEYPADIILLHVLAAPVKNHFKNLPSALLQGFPLSLGMEVFQGFNKLI